MVKLKEVYKCAICGNVVEVVHAGIGQLVCCEQPMELLIEKLQDVGNEKHVPVIEKFLTLGRRNITLNGSNCMLTNRYTGSF